MIHAYAIDPAVAAAWVKDRREFRRVVGEFGRGTVRAFLEVRAFKKWKKAVYDEVGEGLDGTRAAELFKMFSSCRVRRADVDYDGSLPWLENAEKEHRRHAFAAIITQGNPAANDAVLLAEQVGDSKNPKWKKRHAATPSRDGALVEALRPLLENSKELHIVDPYWSPKNKRHRELLEDVLQAAKPTVSEPTVVTLHCREDHKACSLSFFDEESRHLRVPAGVSVRFRRIREKNGGEKLHNRFLLTNLGGVTLGIGAELGDEGQTEDINLMDLEQYNKRWRQYVDGQAFEWVDEPRPRSASACS